MNRFNSKLFAGALLSWYHKNKRDLPWRKTRNPYAIWISEMMLQQTQVKTVLPYYDAFLKRFPTVGALAEAPLANVLKSWEGLGYYSRAHNMHSAAQEVRAKYGGKFPAKAETLRSLPGIGDYTAAAVASIAFDEPVPVVDGNVRRVFSRILADPIADKKAISEFLSTIIPASDPSSFNQGMMELGALICAPRKPSCGACPVSRFCRAFQTKRVSEFPPKSAKKILPVKHWLTLVILHENKILMRQRPSSGIWGGLWECPTIPMPQARLRSADIKKGMETLGIAESLPIEKLTPIRHTFTHFKLVLHPYSMRMKSEKTHRLGTWIDLQDTLPPLPKPFLNLLNALTSTGNSIFSRFSALVGEVKYPREKDRYYFHYARKRRRISLRKQGTGPL